jgi:hypothetical protein
VLLRLSAQLHELSGHAAIDSTFFDRESASRYYYRRTNYRVQTLKTTALVDSASQAVLNVYCTTRRCARHSDRRAGRPCGTRATRVASRPTEATTGCGCASNFATKAFDRRSNADCSGPSIRALCA